jgi:hypothetical protein
MKRMLLALAIAATTACGQPIDIAKAVQADVVSTGWRPARVGGGANKIVPSASVTLKNVSGQPLHALQVNAVFRLVSTNEELGSDFRSVSGSSGLPAGALTDATAFKADRGYTGTDQPDELLTNSHFVDAKVEVFVKAGAGQWTRVGERPIARQLIGR